MAMRMVREHQHIRERYLEGDENALNYLAIGWSEVGQTVANDESTRSQMRLQHARRKCG